MTHLLNCWPLNDHTWFDYTFSWASVLWGKKMDCCVQCQGWLVSWSFEPSQPQRITSGLKVTAKLSNISEYLSGEYPLNGWTFFFFFLNKAWFCDASWVCPTKRLFARSGSQSKYGLFGLPWKMCVSVMISVRPAGQLSVHMWQKVSKWS